MQWSPILRALADELQSTAHGDDETLKTLFRAVGHRFANDMAKRFQDANTLDALSTVFNELWSETNWGIVDLAEHEDHIAIEHRFAPLAQAFGDHSLAWSVGILEGFYQSGFSQVGAGSNLSVRFFGDEDDGLRLIFKLATKH